MRLRRGGGRRRANSVKASAALASASGLARVLYLQRRVLTRRAHTCSTTTIERAVRGS
jgi:hypothetical protein